MTSAWHSCVLKLEQELPAQIFTVWIKPLVFINWSESERLLKIGAPNRMKLDWVKSQFAAKIEKTVAELFHPDAKVSFEITPLAHIQEPSFDPVTNTSEIGVNSSDQFLPKNEAGKLDLTSSGSAQSASSPTNINRIISPVPVIARHIERAKVNPELSFDRFVTGKANQMARAAAEQVAQRPGSSYNPLFFYGGVGLGKTHLIHAVGNYVMALNPNAKVRYIHAEQYVSDVVRAYQRKAFDEFKS